MLRFATCILIAAALLVPVHAENAPGGPAEDTIDALVSAAVGGNRAHERLTWLTDRIGPRLSGSPALDRAIEWAVAELRRDGIEHVWTEPVMVPRWERGFERARIVAPIEFEMALLALGGSVGTTPRGVEAEVVVVDDFDELERVGEGVRGKIVLFNKPIRAAFDSRVGYGSAFPLRVRGASQAARHGAVGMLIRSLGTADYRLPHTGSMRYEKGVPRVPAAAIAAEDADLIVRLRDSGDAVRVHLQLGCRTLPDVESANVIGEIRGRELPDEVVLIAAHLDSWDVGQGAHDDGSGCAIVLETMRLLRNLERPPRRTVRAVLFTNEENGLRGGLDYAARHGGEYHAAAIESDSGGGAPIGFSVTAGAGWVEIVTSISKRLTSVGADRVYPGGGGADIQPLERHGVPMIGLRQDPAPYFQVHHTHADTLDKVNAEDLGRNVAAMSVMAYSLAEQIATLPRLGSRMRTRGHE